MLLRIVLLVLFFLANFNMPNIFAKMMGANESKRPARFAGSWYSDQASVLDKQLANYLQEAKSKLAKEDGRVLALIVPHAGYMFSGQTAAFAYASLNGVKYKRVFLLGPSHHMAFKGAAVPSQSIFETPLGDLEIDRPTVRRLLQDPSFHEADGVFDSEHSLEMQLPWIYKTLGKVKVIPIAIGMVNAEEVKHLAKMIRGELTNNDLIIVSSDFTHYGPRFDYEPFGNQSLDKNISMKIKSLDQQAFAYLGQLDSDALLRFYQNTHDTICGIYPASILMSILPANTEARLLNYSTSQDRERDIGGNSVSYMAISFCAPGTKKAGARKEQQLSEEDGQLLLKIARLALQDHLNDKQKNVDEYAKQLTEAQRSRFNVSCGVFVTLYEKGPAKQLRGCIGYIYPNKPLLAGVCENAINSASNDPRFKPVSLSELDKLIIEINILTEPKFIDDWQKIHLGQDGIILHKAGRQSVFLPKVATEFHWDLPQTLAQLSVKAGLSPDAWRQDAQFETFQSQVFSE